MKNIRSAWCVTLLLVLLLAGCGGSGGGTAGPSQPTKAVLTLTTEGTLPATTQIYGIDATIDLPSGVTVRATTSALNASIKVLDADVAGTTGSASGAEIFQATIPASSPSPISVIIGKSGGFSLGDFAVVNCDIVTGTTLTAGSFTLSQFKAVDNNGATLGSVTAVLNVVLQ
jgi:hypothetical protein